MTRISRVGLLLTATLAAGCGIQLPENYPAAKYTRFYMDQEKVKDAAGKDVPNLAAFELTPENQEKMHATLDEKFFPPPWTWDSDKLAVPHAHVLKGQELYQQHCIHCHGVAGAGDGPTSAFLFPRPRDYRKGLFKWKSTSYAAKPTRADLVSLLKNGAVGTSMPSFGLMQEQDLDDLVDYVIYLSKRGELEWRLLGEAKRNEGAFPDNSFVDEELAKVEATWADAESTVIVPVQSMPILSTESEEYEASVKRGKQIFLGNGSCVKCHGTDAKADPNQMVPEEREKPDDWGNINYPRNLTLGLFRGGRRPIDVYRRIHQGIRGSQMPGIEKTLKPNEIWDVVNFVRTLPYRKGLLADVPPATSATPAAAPHSPAPTGSTGHGN